MKVIPMFDEKELLEELIKCYENDICSGMAEQPDYEEIKQLFEDMIIQVTRYTLGIRYCKNGKCACSPESHIRSLYKKNEEVFKNRWYLYPIPFKTLERIVGD